MVLEFTLVQVLELIRSSLLSAPPTRLGCPLGGLEHPRGEAGLLGGGAEAMKQSYLFALIAVDFTRSQQ